jgi:predicted O-methyltransferase YrrM
MSDLQALLGALRGPALWTGRRLRGLPGAAWGTKGFEFWTFLSVLLHRSNCMSLLELGSGRSTLTLAEYARFRKARFVSIETSREWAVKAHLEISWLGLRDEPVRLVGWNASGTWFDEDQFRAATAGRFDFALIDAPNDAGGRSNGMRDSETALREIAAAIHGASLVLVDDVHRRHVFESMDRMLDKPADYEKWYYDYEVGAPVTNTLCIAARQATPACAAVEETGKLLEMRLYRTFGRENCAED